MKDTKTLTFSFDFLNVLNQDEDISIVELYLCHLGKNRNNCDIDLECIEASKSSFFNKPIIFRLNNKIFPNFSTDVVEHAENPEEMQMAGQVPESSPIEYIEVDDKTYVKVVGILHKAYVPTLMKILERKDGNNKVSIEIIVEDSFNKDDGVLKINKFKLRGIALLGEDVPEGIEGSHMQITKFSKDRCNKVYMNFSKKNNNYVIPSDIKNNIYNNLLKIKDEKCFNFANDIVKNSFMKKEELLDIKNFMKDNELGYSSLDGDKLMEYMNSIDFSQEDYGIGKKIKIDKSKDSMSDASWGKIDKTELRKKVLDAENYKTLVKDVYMTVEEGWENSPSSKLKYPVMEIKNDVAVYNRNGLSSALGYAEAENDEDVISKVEDIYKKTDLDKEEEKKMEKENIKKNKIDEENEGIEKIRDDADAQEDDEKEKERARVEKLNKKKKKVKKNKIEDGDDGEEELEDDVDSDKDYWEKKYAQDFKKMEEKLNALEREKDVKEMKDVLAEYATCLSEETFKEFAGKTEEKEMTKEKFSCDLFSCIAKNKKEETEKSVEAKFSFADFALPVRNNQRDNGMSLENLAQKYKGKL